MPYGFSGAVVFGSTISALILAAFLEVEQRSGRGFFSSKKRASYLLLSIEVFSLWELMGLFFSGEPMTLYFLGAMGALGLLAQARGLELLLEAVLEADGGGWHENNRH